jgi:hypothetical protein
VIALTYLYHKVHDRNGAWNWEIKKGLYGAPMVQKDAYGTVSQVGSTQRIFGGCHSFVFESYFPGIY